MLERCHLRTCRKLSVFEGQGKFKSRKMAIYLCSTMELAKALGIAIEERRIAMDLSQGDLATASGLHRNYIGRVERGEVVASIDTVDRLAAALKCPVQHLWAAAERLAKLQ